MNHEIFWCDCGDPFCGVAIKDFGDGLVSIALAPRFTSLRARLKFLFRGHIISHGVLISYEDARKLGAHLVWAGRYKEDNGL